MHNIKPNATVFFLEEEYTKYKKECEELKLEPRPFNEWVFKLYGIDLE